LPASHRHEQPPQGPSSSADGVSVEDAELEGMVGRVISDSSYDEGIGMVGDFGQTASNRSETGYKLWDGIK
jgi:hypothetical protein